MKKIILVSLTLISHSMLAQDPQIEWQNTIGGSAWDDLSSIELTMDGGYICGGTSHSNISGDKTEDNQSIPEDYWVIKLDGNGIMEWQNTIGGSLTEFLSSIHQTTDGGYIIGGHSTSNSSGDKSENTLSKDYWIVKLNNSGVIQWENTINGDSSDVLLAALQTSNGGYILGGYSISGLNLDKTVSNNGAEDYWIIKLKESTLSASEDDFKNPLVVYPNPTQGKITIDLGETYQEINLKLFSINGQTILSKKFYESEKIELEILFPKGVYLIKLHEPNDSSTFHKIIVN